MIFPRRLLASLLLPLLAACGSGGGTGPSPNAPSIYMSGYPADAIDHQGLLREGIEFLPKPIGLDALVRKVRDMLDGRAPASPVAAAR